MKMIQMTYSLLAGGAERVVVGLSNRLAANEENEVVLVSVLDDAVPGNTFYLKDLSPRVRYMNLHCKRGLEPKAIWRVFQTIRKERPDVVHSHVTVVLLLLPALFMRKVCYFHTIHNMARRIADKAGVAKRAIMHYMFKRKKSEACRRSYRETYHICNDICIMNGSEPLTVTEEKSSVEREVEILKHHPDDLVFIHIARHHPQKNHGRLFRCFLRLEKEGEHFILMVLGDHYDLCQTELKDSKNIFLLGAKKNVGDYMSEADFFVLSSDYEGLPMTLLEAMSMGVVPVSTPAGGVVDVIEDGVNGYLSESFDEEDFYRKIKQAMNERGSIPPERIKQHYETHFSMEACAENYYEAYKKALKE